MSIKELLLEACYTYVNKRIASYKEEIDTIKDSIENNDKNNDLDDDSGNGKLFNDLEKNAQHLSDATKTLDTLKKVNPKIGNDRAVLGSIVVTNTNAYFLSISIGKIEIEESTYFGISLFSPVGELLKNKQVGDTIEFNGNKSTITAIK